MLTGAVLSSIIGVVAKLGLGFFADKEKKRKHEKSIAMMKLEIEDNINQRSHDLAMASYLADREDKRVAFQADVDMQLSQDQLVKQNIISQSAPIVEHKNKVLMWLEVYRITLRPNITYLFMMLDLFLLINFLYGESAVLTAIQFNTLLAANIDMIVMTGTFWFVGRFRA